jgi:phenylpyruvate tautomerase PptA (4-oxalocrotonate tautomerase family)
MPLVRISVYESLRSEKRQAITSAVYDAMRATLGIPENDRFIVLTGHSVEDLIVDPRFMGMERTEDFVLIHVTLRAGRSVEVKQNFYREIARLIHERAEISPDNVMIVLTPNGLEDWSFGRGEAQYVVNSPSGATR